MKSRQGVKEMKQILVAAIETGTQPVWVKMAIEWMEEAEKEITHLKALLAEKGDRE